MLLKKKKSPPSTGLVAEIFFFSTFCNPNKTITLAFQKKKKKSKLLRYFKCFIQTGEDFKLFKDGEAE